MEFDVQIRVPDTTNSDIYFYFDGFVRSTPESSSAIGCETLRYDTKSGAPTVQDTPDGAPGRTGLRSRAERHGNQLSPSIFKELLQRENHSISNCFDGVGPGVADPRLRRFARQYIARRDILPYRPQDDSVQTSRSPAGRPPSPSSARARIGPERRRSVRVGRLSPLAGGVWWHLDDNIQELYDILESDIFAV